jgi:hypothetical protein
MDRRERLLIHHKQNKIDTSKVKRGFTSAPKLNELEEGIPRYYHTNEGLLEYIKYGKQLYKRTWQLDNEITLNFPTQEISDVGALTSPVAGGGSGANATTFNGTQCDQLRADVKTLKDKINELLAELKKAGIMLDPDYYANTI